ncbi:MAG TPA: hypothetical protein VGR89_06955, partial [Puia sp.]|nr:hypothetical protein [Puia sp.]
MEQMHYFKKRTVALLVAFLAFRAAAQEDLGIRNSNRAGIQGSLINPSSIAGSPLEWDLHLFSAQVDFANTFLYAKRSQVPFLGIRRIIKGSIDEDLFLTRYEAQDPNKRYQVNFTAEFLGPSFFITVKNKHEIGLTTALRGIGNIRDITGNAGQNAFD